MANNFQSTQNWDFDGYPLIQTGKSMSLKSTEDLSVLTKNYGKVEQEQLVISKLTWTNFDPST